MFAIYIHNLLATRTQTLSEAESIVIARFFHIGAEIIKEPKP